MARKPKPFATYETREQFEKHFDRIYDGGKERGFKEGRVNALSYILESIHDNFNDQEIDEAICVYRARQIAQRKKQEEIIKSRVEYEVKKRLENSEA